MFSGTTPLLYVLAQAAVEALPTSSIPIPTFTTELPLALLDGFTRAILLCTLIPPAVQSSPVPELAESPWALLLGSFVSPHLPSRPNHNFENELQVVANGGFFLTNLFSFYLPTPLTLTTPPELLPYGWTTTDLWCALVVTALYATLTRAQPFWAYVHAMLSALIGDGYSAEAKLELLDAETARALILAGLLVTRASKTFSAGPFSRGRCFRCCLW